MLRILPTISWLACVMLSTAPAAAQRKPEPPPYRPQRLPDNVADKPLLDALQRLGYLRIAVFVHVHASDVLPEGAVEITGTGARRSTSSSRKSVRQSGGKKNDSTTDTEKQATEQAQAEGRWRARAWRVIPKEDETNAWRIARTFAARLQDTLRHRSLRMMLVSTTDLGSSLAKEVRLLALRDEQEAARRIAKATGADLILGLTLVRALEPDAHGARYGAVYFLADPRRDTVIDSWAWDLKPGRYGAYAAPVLGYYAQHLAVRIHDRLLEYAEQSLSPEGRIMRPCALRFRGLQPDRAAALRKSLEKTPGVRVREISAETDAGVAVVTVRLDVSETPDALVSRLSRRLKEDLDLTVTCLKMAHASIEFDVRAP